MTIDEKKIHALFEAHNEHGGSLLTNYTNNSSELQKLAGWIGYKDGFPFEPTFQALIPICGICTLTYVETLRSHLKDFPLTEKAEILPNLHHFMLAHALKRGHIVITTNFDELIEEAFKKLFPNEQLTILVTDQSFQAMVDSFNENGARLRNPLLVKIHGTLSDYNSLVMTTSGLSVTADKSLNVGVNIDEKKAESQIQKAYSRTTLSVPRVLFLQKIFSTFPVIFMGYSGLDVFDIVPLIKKNPVVAARGLWVNHGFSKNTDGGNSQAEKGPERLINLWEDELEDRHLVTEDTGALSGYILKEWKLTVPRWCQPPDTQKGCISSWDLFIAWLERLHFRRGDGLHYLGLLAFEKGNWVIAQMLLNAAVKEYEKDWEHCEHAWLETLGTLSAAHANNGESEPAISLLLQQKAFIEKLDNPLIYATQYCRLLLDLAFEWINSEKDKEASDFISEVLDISQRETWHSCCSNGK